MTINPSTVATTAVATKSLQLNALDPAGLMAFYRDAIGLTVLETADDGASFAMGTKSGTVLLEIYQTNVPRNPTSAGLYHMAFRLPSREDLAGILVHLAQSGTGISGASDHGYSEALYLTDPEGNGIEIYWDKPKSQWDIRDDGRIAGVTEQLDIEGLLGLDIPEFVGMPERTDLGHMHIHVGDTEKTWEFYRDILGLGFKFPYGRMAIFLATGEYHHHLGANTWKGTDLTPPAQNEQGLRSYSWEASAEDYALIRERLETNGLDYTETDGQLWFRDNSGIQVSVNRN